MTTPDIPASLQLGICTVYQRWLQYGSREAQGLCVCCPAASSVRVHWALPSPRRAPPQQVGAPWCLKSLSIMNLSADNTMHTRTTLGY